MRKILLLTIIALAVFITGCSLPAGEKAENLSSGYELVDSKGHVIKLVGKPKRIVSLMLGSDEVLIEIMPAERIAALTKYAFDPGISNIADKATKVNGRVEDVNVESILSLKPDLIITSDGMYQEVSQALWELGAPVYVYKSPRSVEEVRQIISEIGRVVGEPEGAARLVGQMDAVLADVEAKVKGIPQEKRQTVLWQSIIGIRGGKGTLFDSMCQHAGVINGAAVIGLERNDVLTKENIVRINPDIFLMPTWSYKGIDVVKYREEIRTDPALQTVKAVRNNRLVSVSDSYLYCSSHHIAYGVREIAKAAYPEIFKD